MKTDKISLNVIARIHNDFPTKFGLPRQSGLVDCLKSQIVFEPEYRNEEALRGIEGYSHIWLIWGFSESDKDKWSPTVRPPRLGGNKRMGVFATRSPYRPNPIGMSCVRLEYVDGTVLHVSGADIMDNTPIYDIKPYIPYADSRPDAVGGFADATKDYRLRVEFLPGLLEKIDETIRDTLIGVLSNDPRPAYINDDERIYGFEYAGFDVRFKVKDGTVTVCDIVK